MPILKSNFPAAFSGCDVAVSLDPIPGGREIRLLQLTDMQFIDADQRRTPDRLRIDEINAWRPDRFDAVAGNQIRTLITATRPDVIFMTGDLVYGSFDDAGTTLEWFVRFMDSFGIPWAPVFGNHDNESEKGVRWQCELLEKSPYCLFRRGNVSGNGNYTVGIAEGERLVRVLYMLDSNGCHAVSDTDLIKEKGIYRDQLDRVRVSCTQIEQAQGRKIPAFMAFHIPTEDFVRAEEAKGYPVDRPYSLGVEVEAKDFDFGAKRECVLSPAPVEGDLLSLLRETAVNAVFAGHYHTNNTCISNEDVMWVYGLKTGQYDYHSHGQLGGTLVTLRGDNFSVMHVPAFAESSPFPGGARMFRGFFAEDRYILD